MNVSLTQEMEQWVQQKVGSGLYTSASEVVREALRALHAKETYQGTKLATLRDAVKLGMDSADEGHLSEWDENTTKQIQELGRKRHLG